MSPNTVNLFYLALAWLLYFIVHSALASQALKRRLAAHWPQRVPGYRLIYNLLALLLLIPPLWLLHSAQGEPLWTWHGPWRGLADGLALAALIGFGWSLRYYDMREFLGLNRPHSPEQSRRFSLSPFHRYVRHPWYSFGLVIIWTRDMDPAWLMSCVAITLYFVIGSRLEEQKLVAEFGDIYRRYQRRVPGLMPLPGRSLSRAEAAEIIAISNSKLG